MEVDQLAIAVRQRSGWSSIDLGILLARKWWAPLVLSWIIPAALVFTLASLVFYQYPTIALLVVWWLKPLYDRFPLYIASRRLFGETITVRQALLNARDICATDTLAWLTWRRFNPLRSFAMPVTLLERLRGEARDKRLSVLQSKSGSAAFWLTMVCIHVEYLLVFGAIGLMAWLLPEEVNFSLWGWFTAETGAAPYASNLLSFLAMSLVAPFYVMAGFILYISRRIELEGWDIEVRFHDLARRASTRQTKSAVAICLLAVLTLVALQPEMAHSEVSETDLAATPGSASDAREHIDGVLAGESFHNITSTTSWKWKLSEEPETEGEIPEWFISVVEFLERVWPNIDLEGWRDPTVLLASVLRFAVAVVLISLVVYFFLRYRLVMRAWFSLKHEVDAVVESPPATLFGLEVTRESLPANTPEEVATLWHAGEKRQAVALLYRATLTALIYQRGFSFSESHTETECAQLVALTGRDDLSRFMNLLTDGWKSMAYGHIEPSAEWVKGLCLQWGELFDHEP